MEWIANNAFRKLFNMNHVYVLIMAGGEGKRFAPLSTPDRPKQFLQMVGEGTFIQQTMLRATKLVEVDHIYVATNDRYVDLVKEQLVDLPIDNIIAEPEKRNTAPCIAYASRRIMSRDPDAVIVVLPSDHVILDQEKFISVICQATIFASEDDKLVTLGITPRWPATEYGYIKASSIQTFNNPTPSVVERFVEKPDLATARTYFEGNGFYWNSGMFIWKAEALLKEVANHLPDIHAQLTPFDKGDEYRLDYFSKVRSISIDYGVLEKSGNVVVIPCDFGWSDVGTWEGLYNLYKGGRVAISNLATKTMKEVLGYVAPEDDNICLPWRIEKPWGYEEIWAHTEDYVGKTLCINAGRRLSYQYHRFKEETIRVVHGKMDLQYSSGDSVRLIRMSAGDIQHIPPMTKHRFSAIDDCTVMEVSTPYLGDIVRIEDDFGRKGENE